MADGPTVLFLRDGIRAEIESPLTETLEMIATAQDLNVLIGGKIDPRDIESVAYVR